MFKALGEGRFVRDPVVKPVGNTQVAEFTLAMNEYRKSKDGESVKMTSYFDFEARDSAADIIQKTCQKGTRLLVEAKPRQEKWNDKEGNPRSRIFFRVEEFTVLNNRKETVAAGVGDTEDTQEESPF